MRMFGLLAFTLAIFLTACDDSGTSSSSPVILGTDPESSAEESSSSSNSFAELNCTAILKSDSGWNWNVPKKCRFNPEIKYGTMTDTRDKKVYKTIKIGNQTWMAENLNYADSTRTPSLLKSHWCYNNVAANCDVTGRHYTWAAAIDSMALATDADNPQDCGFGKTCSLPDTVYGICPPGWHLPTQAEWSTLLTAVGSRTGKALKSQTGWNDMTIIANGTDAYGFSALPAGLLDDGTFCCDGYVTYFWSASEYDSRRAYMMTTYSSNDDAELSFVFKYDAYSVRCLENSN